MDFLAQMEIPSRVDRDLCARMWCSMSGTSLRHTVRAQDGVVGIYGRFPRSTVRRKIGIWPCSAVRRIIGISPCSVVPPSRRVSSCCSGPAVQSWVFGPSGHLEDVDDEEPAPGRSATAAASLFRNGSRDANRTLRCHPTTPFAGNLKMSGALRTGWHLWGRSWIQKHKQTAFLFLEQASLTRILAICYKGVTYFQGSPGRGNFFSFPAWLPHVDTLSRATDGRPRYPVASDRYPAASDRRFGKECRPTMQARPPRKEWPALMVPLTCHHLEISGRPAP